MMSQRSREGFSTLWLLLITQVDWPSVHQLPQRSDAFPSSTRSTSTCFGSQTTFIGRHCSLSSYPVWWQSFLEMLTRISISHLLSPWETFWRSFLTHLLAPFPITLRSAWDVVAPS